MNAPPPSPSIDRSSGRVVLIELGRASAGGARRRLDGLRTVLEAAGFEPVELALMSGRRPGPLEVVRRAPATLVRADVVPETMAWSVSAVRAELDRLSPCAVLCQTSRAYHPALVGPWHLCLDYVDRLSVSYRDRAGIAPSAPLRLLYRALAREQLRFERHHPAGADHCIAAGRADAAALGADWVPITVELAPAAPAGATTSGPVRDIGFVGTLDYPPNAVALRTLAGFWPELVRRRPGTTALVAGARPSADTRALVERMGWELVSDFPSVAEIYGRVRIATAPLLHASGIQTKVLEAGAHGVPMVITTAVAAGLDPAFPAVVATGADEWVDAIIGLLDTPGRVDDAGRAVRDHIRDHYTATAVTRSAVRAITGREHGP